MKKKWLALLTAALLLLCFAAAAEPEEDDFGFDFGEGGYTGEWVALKGLDLQFCLPDGWTALETDLGPAFQGIRDDSRVALEVAEEAADVDDLQTWAKGGLSEFDMEEAGLYGAAVEETDARVCVYILDAGRVIAFRFDRAEPDALSRAAALQIAGSTSEDWGDSGEAFDEIDDANDVLAGDAAGDAGW